MIQTNLHSKIFLPELPNSWNRLSSDELEEVNRLFGVRRMEEAEEGEETAERRFKLRVFLCLLGMKVVRRTVRGEGGETVYLFRRKGIRHLWERIPMRAWQVNQWIDSRLRFLDSPTGRTVTPYKFIRLRCGTLRLKAPQDLMADVTFQQYLMAQNLLTAYWQTLRVTETLMQKKAGKKALMEQMRRMKSYRCQFLATLFSPSVTETGEIRDGKYMRRSRRKVWVFSICQKGRNARYFRTVEKRMFPVMEQYFQSVQEAYSRMFPELYTTSGKNKQVKNQIVEEVDMINSVMKEQGFTSYDAVYDSEAVRILGIMNGMCKKAKEIERMNRKYAGK